MDMKKKKIIFVIIGIILFIIAGGAILAHCTRPDGSNMVSREKMLKNIPKGTNWTIATERLLDDYLIAGIVSDNGKAGIAVFEPRENGKYRLLTSCHRENDEIVIKGTYINDVWYNFIWFNGAETERAEIVYTVPNEKSQATVYNSNNSTIICSPAPFENYTMRVAYFDSEGNKYE